MTLRASDAPVPLSPVASPTNGGAATSFASSTTTATASSVVPKKAGARACDIIGHIRSIFRPASRGDGFAALDGFRGALSVWMIMFHSLAYIAQFYPDPDMTAVSQHWSLAPLLIGPLAVDGFFVLTGFLLTYALLDDRSASSQPVKENPKGASFSVRDWYWRRVTRMVPLYVVVLIVYCKVLAPVGQYPVAQVKSQFQHLLLSVAPGTYDMWPTSCEQSILNVLFLNNLLPGGGCLGHTWSFAIQFQFYLLVPLLFKLFGRGRAWLYVCVTFIVASVAFRFLAFEKITSQNNPIDFFFVSFFWYTNTMARANALFMGALMAYACTRTKFIDYLKRAVILRKIIMAGGVCTLVCLIKWSKWFGDGRMLDTPGVTATRHYDEGFFHAIYWIFFNVGSPVSALAFGYLVVAIVYRIGVFGNLAGKLFSAGFWYPFAQLSFSVYLIHPIVYTVILPRFILPDLTPTGLWTWALAGVVINFSLAALLFAIIEKPLDIWLRGSEHRKLSWITFIYCLLLVVASVVLTPSFFAGWIAYEGKPEHLEPARVYLERNPQAGTPLMRAAIANMAKIVGEAAGDIIV